MNLKLLFIRKTKSFFIKCHLHLIFEPFVPFLRNLAYLSNFSKWANNQNILKNDFYSSKWDYTKRFGLYQYINDNFIENEQINYLEFGVASGASFFWWLENNNNPNSTFDGFDTFTGLPEDFGVYKKGHFGGNPIPNIEMHSRANFHQGLFQQTLPGFIKKANLSSKCVILMDADLYSSTIYTLTLLSGFLKKGDIIMFDEFSVPTHEFLAFKNFTESFYINLTPIVAANNYYFMGFEVN